MASQQRSTTSIAPRSCSVCNEPIRQGNEHQVCKLSGVMDNLSVDPDKERTGSFFSLTPRGPECYATPPTSPMRTHAQAREHTATTIQASDTEKRDRLSQTICSWRVQTREGSPSDSIGPQERDRACSPPAPGSEVVDFVDRRSSIPSPPPAVSEATVTPGRGRPDEWEFSASHFTVKVRCNRLEARMFYVDEPGSGWELILERQHVSLRSLYEHADHIVPSDSPSRPRIILYVCMCIAFFALGWVFPLLRAYFNL